MADADKVWVPSKTKVWQLATVDAWKQSTVEVTTAEGQQETLDQAKAARWDPSHDGDIDDLARMNQLHEAPLLTALGRRYKRDAIYTYTGDVLVSVNPYKSIPLLYDLPAVDDEEAFEAMDAARPHVYGIARRAQAAVRATRVNQSVVVSGESGAGKTEASKKVMAFLLALSAARKDAYAEAAVDVDAVLMVSNVILEAFGNAKTIRNDNSSRFGKYIRLVYDDDWRIAGARTDHFLLEKSRLASVDAGERSYHYFYQLVKAKALPDKSLEPAPRVDEPRPRRFVLVPPRDGHAGARRGARKAPDAEAPRVPRARRHARAPRGALEIAAPRPLLLLRDLRHARARREALEPRGAEPPLLLPPPRAPEPRQRPREAQKPESAGLQQAHGPRHLPARGAGGRRALGRHVTAHQFVF